EIVAEFGWHRVGLARLHSEILAGADAAELVRLGLRWGVMVGGDIARAFDEPRNLDDVGSRKAHDYSIAAAQPPQSGADRKGGGVSLAPPCDPARRYPLSRPGHAAT